MNTENESVPVAQRSEALRRSLREVKKGWTDTQIDAILRAKGYCEYCGADVVASVEALSDSEWDHIIPKKHGGEHEDNGVAIDVVFEKNIALACHNCNSLKGGDMPNGVAVTLSREERIAAFQSMVTTRRRDEKVIEAFSAFRQLVEMVRCGATRP